MSGKIKKIQERRQQKLQANNAYVERTKSMYLDSYIKSKLTGNYHATRAVAILDQIKSEEFGMWNGIVYTKECLEAEYWLAKHSAIKNFAAAQISMNELIKIGMTEEEVWTHFKKFQDAKLFSSDYSEFMEDNDDKVARFVKE